MNNPTNSRPTLVVYSREECHLCQDMIQALQAIQEQNTFELEIIDIDKDPHLVSQYNERIPILMASKEGPEICHYHLNQTALDAYLSKIS